MTAQKKTDDILKIPGLVEFSGYWFKKYKCERTLITKVSNKSRNQRGLFNSQLLLSCFVGQPVLWQIPHLKGTVSVISSDSQCKDDNSQYPIHSGTLETCLIKYKLDINVSCFFKLFIFFCGFSAKVTCF